MLDGAATVGLLLTKGGEHGSFVSAPRGCQQDNFSTPANSTRASIPWGDAIILIGTYVDLIVNNWIRPTRVPSSPLCR